MSEDQLEQATPFSEHRLLLLVAGSIVIALMLVGVSMTLYAWSGAAQLDLSRPGYKSVQSQTKQFEKFGGFPADGAIDAKALQSFKELYSKQATEVSALDAFGGDVLSDQVLKIDDPDQIAPTPEQ